jgi:hypothetical protein
MLAWPAHETQYSLAGVLLPFQVPGIKSDQSEENAHERQHR